MNGFYTSLSEALEAAATKGLSSLTLTLTINSGRVTVIAYRKTFDLGATDEDGEASSELTVMTALLRQYGKKAGRGARPFTVQFLLGADPVGTFVSDNLVAWLETKAIPRETVPNGLVQQLHEGTASVVEHGWQDEQLRLELEALKVEDVRRRASSLKVAGAWRQKKAELIDRIIEAEREVAKAAS